MFLSTVLSGGFRVGCMFCNSEGKIFERFISFLINMATPRPGLSSVSDLYAKYFGKFNSVESCRRVSFIKSTLVS